MALSKDYYFVGFSLAYLYNTVSVKSNIQINIVRQNSGIAPLRHTKCFNIYRLSVFWKRKDTHLPVINFTE